MRLSSQFFGATGPPAVAAALLAAVSPGLLPAGRQVQPGGLSRNHAFARGAPAARRLFSPARRKLQNPHFQPPEWWVKEVNECVRRAAGHRRPAAFAPHFNCIVPAERGCWMRDEG
jgi:hypothetical protein